jgi:hypothetical protein
MSGLNVKDPLCSSGGEASSLGRWVSGMILLSLHVQGDIYLLGKVGHGEGLVKKPEFSVLALLVIGVTEDTAVQKRSMNISYHGPDVPSRVWRLARGRELDRVEVVGHWWVKVDRVSFVEGVDLSSTRDLDLYVNQSQRQWIRYEICLVYNIRQGE